MRIQHNTPEINQQLKQWDTWGESVPKKAGVGVLGNKVMVTFYLDASGIIKTNYLKMGNTINYEYHANLIGSFQ